MNFRQLRRPLILLLLLLIAQIADATAHIFTRNGDGVWLVSDTLTGHYDGFRQTSSTGCKVVISRGRLIFNAGHFKDLALLMAQESELPFADLGTTTSSILNLLAPNHMDMRGDPKYNDHLLVVNAGIIQVQGGVFSARMVGQTDKGTGEDRTIEEFTPGIPHGYASTIEHITEQGKNDPRIYKRIAANPREELLKIMKDEAVLRDDEVRAPFTILLLHGDGTVSDYSAHKFCVIPSDAVNEER